MCGRFARQTDKDKLIEAFRRELPDLQIDLPFDFAPRFNIAPSQDVLAVAQSQGRSHPSFALMRWGLTPHFAKDPKTMPAPINVRSETAAEKPMFRQAFQKRRCLIPADGFYEWKREKSGKQPFYFSLADNEPFAFAGIYEVWRGEDAAAPLVSCAIFTTEANEVLRPVHDRMPVILEPSDYPLWCDPEMQDVSKVGHLLKPYPPSRMLSRPVSLHVNSPANDDPACLEPIRTA